MNTRTPDPKQALDYPVYDDEVWVIWTGNEHKWPDPRRETKYLTDLKVHVMNGSALFTLKSGDATPFNTEADAKLFLRLHQAKRTFPYGDLQITTIADLKKARGYT